MTPVPTRDSAAFAAVQPLILWSELPRLAVHECSGETLAASVGWTTLGLTTPVRFLAVPLATLPFSSQHEVRKAHSTRKLATLSVHGEGGFTFHGTVVRMLPRQPHVFFMMFTTTTTVNPTCSILTKLQEDFCSLACVKVFQCRGIGERILSEPRGK